MTAEEAVEQVLCGVEFTSPVELDDVLTVHRAILPNLPEGARLECYHRIREVVFEVRASSNDVIYRTSKKVTP